MITAVTTCMGRREHLEFTLPLMLEEFKGQVVVVDWSCPQNSGEWAAKQGALVVKRSHQMYWNASKARNLGAHSVKTRTICFIDADTIPVPGLLSDIESAVNLTTMLVAVRDALGVDIPSLFGFIAVDIGQFWGVGGYNETLDGYGAEDEFLRAQLCLERGLKVARTDKLANLRHSNELRQRYNRDPLHISSERNHAKLREYLGSHKVKDYATDPRTTEIAYIHSK